MMKTSEAGLKFCRGWEGLYLHTYDDGTGTLTIGYGHTSAAGPPVVRRGMIITSQVAEAMMLADLASVEINVTHWLKRPATQQQFDAFVMFDFNTGALGRSNILYAFNDGAPVTRDLFDAWDHDRVNGILRVDPGLYRRRNAEWTLYSTGQVVLP